MAAKVLFFSMLAADNVWRDSDVCVGVILVALSFMTMILSFLCIV